MKKVIDTTNIKQILISILSAMLILSACNSKKVSTPNNELKQNIDNGTIISDKSAENTFLKEKFIKTIEHRDDTNYKTTSHQYAHENVVVTYPRIEGSSSDFNEQINKLIEADIKCLLQKYPQTNVKVNYEIVYSSNKILSIVYKGTAYSPGNPYSVSVFYTSNINLVNFEKIELKDMININDEFVNYIKTNKFESMSKEVSDYIQCASNDDITNKLQQADSVESIGKTMQSDVNSYITDEYIGIFYGIPHVLGDYAELHIPNN